MTTCIQVQLQTKTTQARPGKRHYITKPQSFDTTAEVATCSGKGHGPINNNLNTASGLISYLRQGDDNIWLSLEQS